MARGAVPHGLRSRVTTSCGFFAVVSNTMRLFDAELATNSRVPLGDRATAIGSAPTPIVFVTVNAYRSTTETVPSRELATYAVEPLGWMATLLGSRPTAISPYLRGTSDDKTSKTEIVFCSGLTLTSRK